MVEKGANPSVLQAFLAVICFNSVTVRLFELFKKTKKDNKCVLKNISEFRYFSEIFFEKFSLGFCF
jgi:hypothetical protein